MIALLLVLRREIVPLDRIEHGPVALGIRDLLLPLRHSLLEIRRALHGLLLSSANLRAQAIALLLLLGRRHFGEWLVVVVQKRVELEILALRDGIELVIVALRALDGHSQPRPAHGIDAID